MRFLLLVLLFLAFHSEAQKQLVLLKRGKPVGRYGEGESIFFVMKNGRQLEGTIIELLEFSAVISRTDSVQLSKILDTVPFNKVYKVKIPRGERKGFAPLVGGLLMTAGALYLGIDLINSATGYNTEGIDKGVVQASAIMVGVGSLLVFIKPEYRRMNSGTIFRTVGRDSKFYKSPSDP